MGDNQEPECLLSDPISFSDLVGSGATLQMNLGYEDGISNEIYDEVFGSDDDDDNLDDNKNISPWLGSFDELKAQMAKVSDDIYKRIVEPGNLEKGPLPHNVRVTIRYSSYWQGESKPFDSAVFSFNIGECNVLEGLERAVCTMNEGEIAQFIISYKLLFGEMGCPPRIKKRADGLYEIELISYKCLDNKNDAGYQFTKEDSKLFSAVLAKAKEIHLKGLNFSKQGMYKNAAELFEKAGSALEFCKLANEAEEREQTTFLIRLYTNLVVAYNKLKRPGKACIICRKIWQITDNKPPCKVIVQKGRALVMLGDYIRAKELFERAHRMEPNNIEIKKDLEDLEERFKKLRETQESIRIKALGLDNVNKGEEEMHLCEFKKNMFDILQDFKFNSEQKTSLPSNLTDKEINLVDELAKDLEIKLTFSESEKLFFIHK